MISHSILQKIYRKSAEQEMTCSAEQDSLLLQLFYSTLRIRSIGTSLSICCDNEIIFQKICNQYGTIHHNRNDLSFTIVPDDIEEFIEVFAECALQEIQSVPVSKTPDIESTEAKTETKLRRGQAWLRDRAMMYWNGRCAVTGATIPEILEACHIKPWSAEEITGKERLSLENIILLSVHLHRLFDAGLITFADDGKLLISKKISQENVEILLGNREMRLSRQPSPGQKKFLDYHRKNIFKAD